MIKNIDRLKRALNLLRISKITLNMLGQQLTGRISTNSKGFGFFSNPDLEKEIFIEPGKLGGAFNGDEVKIKVTGENGEGPYGEVVEVISRYRKSYVGAVDAQSKSFFVILDDKKAYADFFIPNRHQNKARHGDKVVVEIIDWEPGARNPVGKIVSVLGKKGEHDAEMKAIVVNSGFDGDFPPEVEAEADRIKKEQGSVKEKDLIGREDLRGVTTLTIDPTTAKDFDDAISLRRISEDMFEVGIHIADVSHYVKFGSKIDKEAFERGFSVYMVDRTIPMLPEVLSNDLCSLNPHEDKFAFSAIVNIRLDGTVIDRRFTKSVIRSDHRFTYEDAQEVINQGHGEYFEELNTLNTIAKSLVEKNRAGGSIEFETDEVKFELDPEGRPIRVVRLDRLDTHKLVEEMMLLANREVAKVMYTAVKEEKADLFLYRVHDVPQIDRVESYAALVRALGHKLPVNEEGTVRSKDMSQFLESLEGTPEEGLLKTAAIRSMSKALYSTHNIGHYGLSFEFYTHFTSPIRRYADLAVHRLLAAYLDEEEIPTREVETYLNMIPHITERENAAVEAERSSIKYKHVEYMTSRIGEEFDGTITGVSEWGIYVEDDETKAEGMIGLRSLDEPFSFDREGYRILGDKTKTVFRLGDRVRFRVVRADLDKKQLDYELVTKL